MNRVHIIFFNDTATTEIYTLSLHDALPISGHRARLRPHHVAGAPAGHSARTGNPVARRGNHRVRSEEHTSELQSRQYLVCRLLLEKQNYTHAHTSYASCCLHTHITRSGCVC